MNNKFHFSMARAVELQDEAKTLKEADYRFERSCSLCPKAGFCIEDKCYLAQLHNSKIALLEAEEITKSGNSTVKIRTTRKYNRKGVMLRLLTNASKKVGVRYQELALDNASVYVDMGDYANAYKVLRKNGLIDEAEALKKVAKGGE